MLSVFPFGSSSLYTASFAITSSFAATASFAPTAITASFAATGSGPSGSRGKPDICLITFSQYQQLLSSSALMEVCTFP